MRSIWKGGLNFGMVSIPCKIYSSVDDKRVSFHQYHADCGSRVQMPKWCPVCNRKLEQFEIKKGYEISDQRGKLQEGREFIRAVYYGTGFK